MFFSVSKQLKEESEKGDLHISFNKTIFITNIDLARTKLKNKYG